jgi:hypothetical protein
VLGLTVQTEGTRPTPGGQDAHWVEMATASGALVEAFDQNPPERALFHVPVIGFLVDDVASARAELENKGVNFIGSVGRGTAWEWSYFRSPEGYVYQIMAELKL